MFWHLGKLAEELLGDDAVYIGEIFEHFELFVSHLQLSWKCSKKKNSDFAFQPVSRDYRRARENFQG